MNERALRISPKDRRAHEPMHDAILSRYTSLTELAQGEMTVVYRALPRAFACQARPVALKCLKPQFARRPECRDLLRHEAWVSSQLHHAHLTRCLEVIETADFCGVVQNYVEGQNLAQLCDATEGMEAERYLVPLLVDVLEGLQALHTALDDQSWPLLLLHGALTTRHVLVGVDGMARLTDFSQARSRRGQLFNYPEHHHSQAQHMAPEQVLDPESVDHRSEVFLVGVMLWEGLTGRKLFAAESEEATSQHLLRRPVLPPSKVGLRPVSALDAVCLRALSRDPDARYDSALDMACALREAAQGAELFASRAEICAWVRSVVGPHTISRSFVSQRDDEPTTPFSRTPHSGTHQVIRAAGSRSLR